MWALGTAILIKPDTLPERTKSGALAVPKSSTEMLPEGGEVVDVGPACTEISIGMRVIFPRKQASFVEHLDCYFVNEHQIKYAR